MITKVDGGFTVTRTKCIVCGEPPFGDEYCCGHKQMIDIAPLSFPQVRFCRGLVDELGTRLHGFTLSFETLDELTHFNRKLYGIKTTTTKDYVTMTAIERKLLAAIRKQQLPLKVLRSHSV